MLNFPQKYLFKPVSSSTLRKKKEAGICIKHGCTRPPTTGKAVCATCRSRLYRLKHKRRYVFNQVKESARKRKIPFELSFDEFVKFDLDTGYSEAIGREPHSMTIDRIRSELPYRAGNIRTLSWEANVKRSVEGLREPWEAIAKALHLFSGSSGRWQSFRRVAGDVMAQVEALQGSQGGSEEESEEENCPF